MSYFKLSEGISSTILSVWAKIVSQLSSLLNISQPQLYLSQINELTKTSFQPFEQLKLSFQRIVEDWFQIIFGAQFYQFQKFENIALSFL